MNCDDIKLMISEYLDNELAKEKEAFLFTHLSSCDECREEFKMQNSIQYEVKIHQKEVSEKFEEKVFDSIQKKEQPFIKRWITKPTPAYINYVLGFVIIMITIFSFLQLSSLRHDLNSYQERYEAAFDKIQFQAQQINLMMSNMPAVQITMHPAKM
ncbi:MAG: zf-HC2 domain-containing protein [Ignavibacteriales bacterium]|nr:zf-HC2 domain-containing protein [Ignavibacteriales bacterium]